MLELVWLPGYVQFPCSTSLQLCFCMVASPSWNSHTVFGSEKQSLRRHLVEFTPSERQEGKETGLLLGSTWHLRHQLLYQPSVLDWLTLARQIQPTRIRIKNCQVCVPDILTIPKPGGGLSYSLKKWKIWVSLMPNNHRGVDWNLLKPWSRFHISFLITLQVISPALCEAQAASICTPFSLIGMCLGWRKWQHSCWDYPL